MVHLIYVMTSCLSAINYGSPWTMFAAALCAVERRTVQLAKSMAEESWFSYLQDQQFSPGPDPNQPDIQILQVFLAQSK
jgi:hypothetical protein